MAILFVATSIADVITTASAQTVGDWMSNTVKESIYTGPYGGNAAIMPINNGLAIEEFYAHWFMRQPNPQTLASPNFMQIFADANLSQKALRFASGDSNMIIPKVIQANGTEHDLPAFNYSAFANNVTRVDIYLKRHQTLGRLTVKLNGVIVSDFTGNTMYDGPTWNYLSLAATGPDNGNYSGIILADEPTDLFRLHQVLPTGNGSEQQWTGDYTTVDETGNNQSDYLEALTTNKTSLFTAPAYLTAYNNYNIYAAIVAGRGLAGTPVAGINGVMRVNGNDYEAEPTTNVGVASGPFQAIFYNNPETLEPWVMADVNAAQFGIISTP